MGTGCPIAIVRDVRDKREFAGLDQMRQHLPDAHPAPFWQRHRRESVDPLDQHISALLITKRSHKVLFASFKGSERIRGIIALVSITRALRNGGDSKDNS